MIAFLDIETGGFSVTKNGICDIALVTVDEDFNPVAEFYMMIKPYPREEEPGTLVSYKDDALHINGHSVEYLTEHGHDAKEVMNSMYQFMADHEVTKIIGHNVIAFDIPRVDYLFKRFLVTDFFGKLDNEDTLILARKKLSLSSNTLHSLCEHFGVTNKNPHNAIADVMATIDVYKELL